MRTVVEVYALLCFVEDGMVQELGLIKTEQGNVLLPFEVLVGSFGLWIVEEGVVDIGIPSDVSLVMKEA